MAETYNGNDLDRLADLSDRLTAKNISTKTFVGKMADLGGMVSNSIEIDGTIEISNDSQLIFDDSYLNIFDLKLYSKSGMYPSLDLPNPYPAELNAPVHTSIVKSSRTFNGYKFWIAYTPYPNANSDFENPCVVATNDFKSFIEPTSNPIVDKPAIGYNADTNLVFNNDEKTLYLLFRERGNGLNSLKIMHTTNGKDWSEPIVLFSGELGTDFASPSAWWNGASWVITYHNLDADSPWPIYRVVSDTSDIYGTYSEPMAIDIPLSTNGLDLGWWHSCFNKVGDNQIIGLVQDNIGAGGSGDLYLVQSFNDGESFELFSKKIIRNQGYYRSTFYRDGETLVLMPTTLSGIPKIYRAETGYIEDTNNYNNKRAEYLTLPTIFPDDAIIVDSFTRADSPSLGTSETGQNWIMATGSYEIKSNKAYAVSTNSRAIIDTLNKNIKLSSKISMTAGVQQWLMIKYVDSANYIRIGFTAGVTTSVGANIVYQEIKAGAISRNISTDMRMINDEALSASCIGRIIKIYINNEPIYTIIYDSFYEDATIIGFQSNAGATSSFNDVIVTKQ